MASYQQSSRIRREHDFDHVKKEIPTNERQRHPDLPQMEQVEPMLSRAKSEQLEEESNRGGLNENTFLSGAAQSAMTVPEGVRGQGNEDILKMDVNRSKHMDRRH